MYLHKIQSLGIWIEYHIEDVIVIKIKYDYTYTGYNQSVYIIDTGIDITHSEFEGRAKKGIDVANDLSCLNSHGTHVAGTVGGKTFGVAKDSTLIDVRVLNCAGSGTYSGILAAIEWISKQPKGVICH